MSIYIKDAVTDKAVRKLAKLRGVTLTEAIRGAIERALADERGASKNEIDVKLRELQDRVARWPKTGSKADKAFYDWLSGEE
jgi:antitoxin VapB